MSKLLIALIALDIGISLSKVYIFSWKLNFLAKNNKTNTKLIGPLTGTSCSKSKSIY